MKCKIIIFRHGQTFYNKNKVFTGWKDSKLTPKGISQAKKIAENLKNENIKIAFHTRLSRSKDTLKEVLKYQELYRVKKKRWLKESHSNYFYTEFRGY